MSKKGDERILPDFLRKNADLGAKAAEAQYGIANADSAVLSGDGQIGSRDLKAPQAAADTAIPDVSLSAFDGASQKERDPYKSGDIFAEQILRRQDEANDSIGITSDPSIIPASVPPITPDAMLVSNVFDADAAPAGGVKKPQDNPSRQWEERAESLPDVTKLFLRTNLKLTDDQIMLVEGDGILNHFFTRLGNADFSDMHMATQELKSLKSKYHPDKNGDNEGEKKVLSEKMKIVNVASRRVKSSYGSYHPEGETKKESDEELRRREAAVRSAKTFDDLFDTVASFETVYSESFRRDVQAEEWINRMKVDRAKAGRFSTYEEFMNSDWKATVTRTHGIRDKFSELVLEMIRQKEKTAQPAGNEGLMALEAELDGLRMAYAKKDYEETGVWKRLSGIFGKSFKDEKALDEKVQYQLKLREILDKKIEDLRQKKEGEELKQAMAETLQYFSMESKVKLYDAWTDVQMERKGFSEKILDLGRKYNKLPLWKKAAIGVVVFGVAGAAAGGLLGTAGGAVAASLVGLRRGAAAGGLFATLEAGLEKLSRYRAEKSVDTEKKDLFMGFELEKDTNRETRLTELQERLSIKIKNADQDLEGRVKGRDRRRVAALALSIGAVFGASSAIHYFSDAEVDVESSVSDVEIPPPADGGSGVPVENPVSSAVTPAAEALSSIDTIGAAAEMTRVAAIGEFVQQDITVAKGDSVWKIGGRLADQLNLEGAQRTHFIDSLKDQFGDVQLHEGQVINMGEKGINQEFIEKALGKSTSLTAEQIASIEANDAKIAAYAAKHPGITLTEGVIENQILHPMPTGVHGTDIHGSRAAIPTPDTYFASPDVATAVSPAEAPFTGMSPVEMRRGSDWFMQIFRVDDQNNDWIFNKKEILSTKMTDILKIENNDMVSVVENSHFDPAQSKNLQEFTSELPKVFPGGKAALSDFFRARPNISVGEYLARVAKVVPQGTRIGLYTTTN